MPNKKAASKVDKIRKPALSILVPVYNEEATIGEILRKVTSLPIKNYEVLVVDDGSHDTSKENIESFNRDFRKRSVSLKVFLHTKNRGKGAGIKTGLAHAKGEYFIVQDADLEYDPADIPVLLAKAEAEELNAVYGSRFLGKINNMPRPNYYANKFYNFLLRRLYNTQLTDMHTCYKLVKTTTFRDLALKAEGFDYATELVSKLLKRGIDIEEAPISFYGRSKKQGKKIGYMDGVECTYKLLKYRFSKI